MDREGLKRIDAYVEELFAQQDEALRQAVEDSRAAGLPEIQISPSQGKLLYLLTTILGARRILEVGTLGGYSTIWLARALPQDGRLVSLELSEHHAAVARNNLNRAGLSGRVQVRVADARDSLAELREAGEVFDLTFIDAEKEGYQEYLEWALALSRPGSVIIADNVVRSGRVIEPEDGSQEVISSFNRQLSQDVRLESLILPLLRENIDGISISRVKDQS